jgi:Icc protein
MRTEPLRVLQLTDIHMLPEPEARLHGIDPQATLEGLLAQLRSGPWQPEVVIASGDLSNDESAASYRRLRPLLASLALPVYCVCGNHDEPSAMRESLLGGPIQRVRVAVHEPWQLLFLESRVPGEDHGHLGPEELAALEEALGSAPDRHTLVVLHHGPVPVCPLPNCRLDNAEELSAILGRHPNVRAVLSGHNHCAVDEVYRGVRALVTPAACNVLEHPADPQDIDPQHIWASHHIDSGRRAFRWLELFSDGRIETGLVWGGG